MAASRTTLGRYRIEDELGRGGMGVVYRAVDPELERPVAVKLILLEGAGETSASEMETRFRREAKAGARVHHPGVVAVYDVGRAGNELYLVMELVNGGSLASRLRGGAYPSTKEALLIVADVADALAAAHAAGLVHRDVKPANILFTESGQVKVTDFGVARAMGDSTELTRTGMVVGSPAYMAPEQIKGEKVDPRADVFALGVILYEVLLRRKPFGADTITTLVYEILHKDPFANVELTASLPPALAAFLRQALAKDPETRVPTAVAFAAEARRLAANGGAGEAAVAEQTGATTALPAVALAVATPPSWQAAPTALGPLPLLTPPLPPPQVPSAASTPPLPPVPASPPPATAPRALMTPPAGDPAVSSPSYASTTLVGQGRRRVGVVVVAVVALLAIALVAAWLRKVPSEPAQSGPEVPRVGDGGAPADVSPGAPSTSPSPDGDEAPTAPPRPIDVTPPRAENELPGASAVVVPARPEDTSPLAEDEPGSGTFQAPELPAGSPVTPSETEEPAFTPPAGVADQFECQEGAEFNVSPEDALVTINGRVLGKADDWDGTGGGQTYKFPRAGTYYAHFTASGYEAVWVRIVVSPNADDEVADIDTELSKAKRKK